MCAGGRQQVQLLSINAYNFKATLDQAMLTALSDSETVRHTHTHTHTHTHRHTHTHTERERHTDTQPFLFVQSFFFTFGMTNDHDRLGTLLPFTRKALSQNHKTVTV